MVLSLSDFELEKKISYCVVMTAVHELPEADQAIAVEAMAGSLKQYPHTKVAEVLSAAVGRPISDKVVGMHRLHKCSCPRD